MENRTVGNEFRLIIYSLKTIDYAIAITFIGGLILASCTKYLLIGCLLMVLGTGICFLKDGYRKFKEKIGG